MKQYIICGLDSEHYMHPDIKVMEIYDEQKEIGSVEKDTGLAVRSISSDSEQIIYGDDKTFYVQNWFQVDTDDPYAVVYHHAYEGVDFRLETTGTYRYCRDFISQDMLNVWLRIPEEDRVEFTDQYNWHVIDDNYQWHVWNIVPLKSLAAK